MNNENQESKKSNKDIIEGGQLYIDMESLSLKEINEMASKKIRIKKKKEPMTYLHIRIPLSLKKQLVKAAEQEERTASNLVRLLIREHVKEII
ncbi:MAG: hypothetical protein WC996_08445 [Peptostreptococcales bacterium]|jgi:predicted HicB family RNase H-like nuclease